MAEVTTHPEPELVVAVVSPVGTDIQAFQDLFTDLVKRYGYEINPLRLSAMAKFHYIAQGGTAIDETNEFARVNALMTAGNTLRKNAQRGDVLALHAIAAIRRDRDEANPQPRPNTIHFLRSLKHPDEVEALRRVYGAGFFLIGLQATESQQRHYLTKRKWMTEEHAETLIKRDRDEHEEKDFGQHTRDTFTLADFFVRVGDDDRTQFEEVQRFMDLIFGYPYHTPTLDEHAMFLAHAAALRSGQLARQVGAVVVDANGELIATDANDVPRFGGGLYWPPKDGRPDVRDHVLGYDSNDRAIAEIIDDVVVKAKNATRT